MLTRNKAANTTAASCTRGVCTGKTKGTSGSRYCEEENKMWKSSIDKVNEDEKETEPLVKSSPFNGIEKEQKEECTFKNTCVPAFLILLG